MDGKIMYIYYYTYASQRLKNQLTITVQLQQLFGHLIETILSEPWSKIDSGFISFQL